jgi:hypothetical protein
VALLASALVRLPEAWPWLGRRLPIVAAWSNALLGSAARMRALAWADVVLGVALGIYTGILLDTMVARPLWNSAILGPLFLCSGLSAGAATMHLLARRRRDAAAPQGMIGGALNALCQPLGPVLPERSAADALIRTDIAFLAIELLLISLLLVNLQTSSASHAGAAALLMGGTREGLRHCAAFDPIDRSKTHVVLGASGRARLQHASSRPSSPSSARPRSVPYRRPSRHSPSPSRRPSSCRRRTSCSTPRR